MKRALIVALPEKGHLNPLLGPADALQALGYEVAWWTPRDVSPYLAASGFPRSFVPAGRAPPDDGHRGAAFSELLAAPERLRLWIRQMLVDAAHADVEPLRATVRDFRPEVMAMDPMAYAGAIVAELEGIPWVGWSTSLNPVVPDDWTSELIETTRALEPARQALFAGFGLEARFRVSDVLGPRGTVAFATSALVGAAPRGVTLAGPSLPARPRGEPEVDLAFADGRPLLYVSFGTQAYDQPDAYARVFEAAEGLGLAVLASAGELASTRFRTGLPDGMRCVPFAPQLTVLRRAAGMVTHGGANSVMEAMAFGVPLAISPLCNDQVHNLRFVERAGAGVHVDLTRHATATLRKTLAELCTPEGPCRRGAAAIARSYAASSGALVAARQVAGMVR